MALNHQQKGAYLHSEIVYYSPTHGGVVPTHGEPLDFTDDEDSDPIPPE